jgi:hypothetical protein
MHEFERYAGHRQPALSGRRVSLGGALASAGATLGTRHRRSGRLQPAALPIFVPGWITAAGRCVIRWVLRLPRRPKPLPPYPFLPAEGESLHQIPVGPVHAGIIEPGHFRFTANGEAVVRLEERLGYVHKGIESLLNGASLERAARLVGRVSGDSTVAYALAFARAVEAATETEIPARAHWLRALMAELERLANHCGDIGAVCNDAAFALMLAHCAVLREQCLRASAACFGHRLLMDCVIPGGVAVDLPTDGVPILRALLAEMRRQFPPWSSCTTTPPRCKTAPPIPASSDPGPAVRLRRRDRPCRRSRLRRPPRAGLSALRPA